MFTPTIISHLCQKVNSSTIFTPKRAKVWYNEKMNKTEQRGGVYIAPGRNPWPHELRTAKILALAGYYVEFLPEGNLHTPDIRLDGVEYETKSPETEKTSSLEQSIRTALKQCPNIIIDSSRMKMYDTRVRGFLIKKCREQKQIKKMLFVTKRGKVIDVFSLI